MIRPSPPRWIYKICTPAEHAALAAPGGWAGSPDDLRDGFVHFSTADQVPGTLARHFAGRGPLVLLEVDATALPEGLLRWEPSRKGAVFPHLYGRLHPHQVQRTVPLPADPGETPAPPDGLRGATGLAARMV